jgi:hypothetical protein
MKHDSADLTPSRNTPRPTVATARDERKGERDCGDYGTVMLTSPTTSSWLGRNDSMQRRLRVLTSRSRYD